MPLCDSAGKKLLLQGSFKRDKEVLGNKLFKIIVLCWHFQGCCGQQDLGDSTLYPKKTSGTDSQHLS